MTNEAVKAQERVLARHPDAEVKGNDYNEFWIGRPELSEAIPEDPEGREKVDSMPCETANENYANIRASHALEEAAIEAAWIDADRRLPALPSKHDGGDGHKSQHWNNPETGQAECECCCGWALDTEKLHKAAREALIVMSGGEGCNSPFDAERWSNAVIGLQEALRTGGK